MILRTFPCAATDPAPRATLHCAQFRGIRCRGGANPELLFAAGYAACFHSALRLVGSQAEANVNDSAVGAKVGIGSTDGGGFGLTVVLEVSPPSRGRSSGAGRQGASGVPIQQCHPRQYRCRGAGRAGLTGVRTRVSSWRARDLRSRPARDRRPEPGRDSVPERTPWRWVPAPERSGDPLRARSRWPYSSTPSPGIR